MRIRDRLLCPSSIVFDTSRFCHFQALNARLPSRMNNLSCASTYPFLILTPYRLDNIGIAGFSYDLEALKDRQTPVKLVFDSFEFLVPMFSMKMAGLFGPYFPNLFGRIWNPRRRIVRAATLAVHEIASDLLDKASQETGEKGDKSILGVSSFVSPIWSYPRD